MTLGTWYWILMALWLFVGVWVSWPRGEAKVNLVMGSGNILLFILLVLLGWHVFGAPVHG